MADSYMRQSIIEFGGQTYSDSLSAACTLLLRQWHNYLKSVKWAAATDRRAFKWHKDPGDLLVWD